MSRAAGIGLRAVTVALVLAALLAPPAAAQTMMSDSALDARTAAISATLRCPVCQGESIQDSPADLAKEMREVVRDQLRAGKTPDEIRTYFVGRYGEWILLEPKVTGLNIMLYALPIVLVVGGIALIYVLVKRWSQPSPDGAPPAAP